MSDTQAATVYVQWGVRDESGSVMWVPAGEAQARDDAARLGATVVRWLEIHTKPEVVR